METQNTQRYPISSQPFPEIREKGITYIDKTDMIYEMVSEVESELNKKLCGYERIYGKRAEIRER